MLIRLPPERVGIAIHSLLTNHPPRPAVSAPEQLAIAQAHLVRHGADGQGIAWSWGQGPIVILVHGWGGRASQLAPLAAAIAALGFRAVAIDITGHGASPRRGTLWRLFFRDIGSLAERLGGDVHAFVGHSSGGLAMMAARRVAGIRAPRYICICSPTHPFKTMESFHSRLAPSPAGTTRYQAYLAEQFQTSWDALQAGVAYAGAGRDLMLFYDEKDRFIPHTEGDKILAWCPGAHLVKANANGHNGVLADPALLQSISKFLVD